MTAYVRVVQAATLGELLGLNASISSATYFLDGEVSGYSAVVPVGEHIIAFTGGLSAGNVEIRFGVGVNNATSGEVEFLRVAACLAEDAHLPYQRVNTATDYDADPAKFPAYLSFDGVDDALQTGNIDFTGTDKMTVWAGVTKLSDAAAFGVVAELSAAMPSVTGAFAFYAPGSTAGTYAFGVKGSAQSWGDIPGNSAHISNVLSFATSTNAANCAGMIAARNNGSVATLSGGSDLSSTGNYGNYPLYIGSRAGTSLYFNGRLGCLIVRGAQSSLSQIEATELYIKQKVGIA